ncbi:hypothetical protein [Dinoroseobacter sp. S124A]|uniref:hypothetical protein n=1 Tax=Dinoroseobacter sp. S124A TaxID=3415128 RepID=UPI003C7BBC3F
MKPVLLATTTCLLMAATAASAATRQINFTADPLGQSARSAPFGLSTGDSVSGSFTFDDSSFSGAGTYDLQPVLLSFTLTTGTQSWSLADVEPNSLLDRIQIDDANEVLDFGFILSSGAGEVRGSTNNTFLVANPGSSQFIFCNGCVSFEEVPVEAIPLPATLPLGVLALGGLGWVTRRRAQRA